MSNTAPINDRQRLEIRRHQLHQAMKAYNRIPSASNYNALTQAMLAYQEQYYAVNGED